MKKETMMEGNCKEIVLMMQSVIDGNATEEERRVVAEHIRHCETCGRVMQDMTLIRRESAAVAAEPPCDLKDRILKCVTEENRSAAIRRVRKSRSRMRGITGTVAAAAVITLCVFGVSRYVKGNADCAAMVNLAGMQESCDAAETEAASEVADGFFPEESSAVMYVDEEAETTEKLYGSADILEKAKTLIGEYAISGMYAEVFYADVKELPGDTAAMIAGKEKEIGFYETDDFASFVSENNVTMSGVQYEFKNGTEIIGCGLEYGGSGVLLILVID